MRAHSYALLAACVIGLGLFTHSAALSVGFTVDDYAQLAMIRGLYPVPRAPLELFTFTDGSAAENHALREAGFLPWWSHPGLRVSMCRPLASALMQLDWSLFGMNAHAYQLHSLLWWLAMMALAAVLLRRLLPERLALLALLLFACDDAHSMALGWIAMRNAIMATAFALLALILRHSALQAGASSRRAPALIAFTLALLSGEHAIAFLGYALLLELSHAQGLRARLLSIAPWGALMCVYFGLRAAFGFGAYGSGMYIDPFAEAGEFLQEAKGRFPALAGDLGLGFPADFWTGGWPWAGKLAQLKLIPPEWVDDIRPLRGVQEQIGWYAFALIVVVIGVAAAFSPAGRRARFLALGAPLALLPVLSPLPEGRVLMPALIGWSVALVCFVDACRAAAQRGVGAGWPRLGVVVGRSLIGLQLVSGLFFGSSQALITAQFAKAVRASILAPGFDSLRDAKHVLLLSAADPTTTIYVGLVRRVFGRPAPRSVELLTTTFSRLRLTRVASDSFVLERVSNAFTIGDAYARAINGRPMREGDRVSVGGMRVAVERVESGMVMRARFQLDVPLDDPGVVLLTQTANGLQRVEFPALGGEALLRPPEAPLRMLQR